MINEINEYNPDKPMPEDNIVSDIKKISEDDLIRLSREGNIDAIEELIERRPELGDPDVQPKAEEKK